MSEKAEIGAAVGSISLALFSMKTSLNKVFADISTVLNQIRASADAIPSDLTSKLSALKTALDNAALQNLGTISDKVDDATEALDGLIDTVDGIVDGISSTLGGLVTTIGSPTGPTGVFLTLSGLLSTLSGLINNLPTSVSISNSFSVTNEKVDDVLDMINGKISESLHSLPWGLNWATSLWMIPIAGSNRAIWNLHLPDAFSSGKPYWQTVYLDHNADEVFINVAVPDLIRETIYHLELSWSLTLAKAVDIEVHRFDEDGGTWHHIHTDYVGTGTLQTYDLADDYAAVGCIDKIKIISKSNLASTLNVHECVGSQYQVIY